MKFKPAFPMVTNTMLMSGKGMFNRVWIAR